MNSSEIELMRQSLENLEMVLDATPAEILQCFEGVLLSEEDISELKDRLSDLQWG
jgi:tetrahydromethanopterin S-methyltransferase subunit G